MKPTIVRRHVTLAEIPTRGWLYREHGLYYKSLGNALRMVNADNAAIAKNGVVVLTHMTYVPATEAGTQVVFNLTKGNWK